MNAHDLTDRQVAELRLDRFVSGYGRAFRSGIISEHESLAIAQAGAVERRTASGRRYLVPALGGRAIPVVCSELIEIPTEDGPIVGRCGLPVEGDGFCCPGHQGQVDRWRIEGDVCSCGPVAGDCRSWGCDPACPVC